MCLISARKPKKVDAGDDKSSIRPTKMCSLFTERRRGRNAAFSAPSNERKAAFRNAARSAKKRPAGRPRVRKSSQAKSAAGTPNGRNPEHRFSQAKAWETTWPEHSGPRRRMRLLKFTHRHAASRAAPSPQRGRNQKNGRRLRSGMMKKDARFSNKKAARPHEDSARTSRLTGKAFSDRS